MHFNPRAPYGARRAACIKAALKAEFQSTRPIRGATQALPPSCSKDCYFNPRAPYGARPHGLLQGRLYLRHFNPRAPYGARLVTLVHTDGIVTISIHAPHTGRDPRCPLWARWRRYFNPRAPYGARPQYGDDGLQEYIFQSTRPIRGATNELGDSGSSIGFQSTRPIRGATDLSAAYAIMTKFQSTRPIRGATDI